MERLTLGAAKAVIVVRVVLSLLSRLSRDGKLGDIGRRGRAGHDALYMCVRERRGVNDEENRKK